MKHKPSVLHRIQGFCLESIPYSQPQCPQCPIIRTPVCCSAQTPSYHQGHSPQLLHIDPLHRPVPILRTRTLYAEQMPGGTTWLAQNHVAPATTHAPVPLISKRNAIHPDGIAIIRDECVSTPTPGLHQSMSRTRNAGDFIEHILEFSRSIRGTVPAVGRRVV